MFGISCKYNAVRSIYLFQVFYIIESCPQTSVHACGNNGCVAFSASNCIRDAVFGKNNPSLLGLLPLISAATAVATVCPRNSIARPAPGSSLEKRAVNWPLKDIQLNHHLCISGPATEFTLFMSCIQRFTFQTKTRCHLQRPPSSSLSLLRRPRRSWTT